jgi:hypothetical protein
VTQTTLTAVFDAAGRRSSSTAPSRRIGTQTFNVELDENYDGDGQQVKEVMTVGTSGTSTYRLRSSMLGGQIVDEIDGNGAKQTGFIYAGGQPIARYQSTQLLWMHRDPLNTRERLSSSTGALSGGAEFDPSHSSVGMNDPGPSGDGTDPGLMYPRNGDPTDLSGGCMIDGGVAPCSSAMSQVNGGAGVATDPYETPSTRWNPSLNSGQGGFEIFHAFADGYVGYGPIGARYLENGAFKGKPALGNYQGTPSNYSTIWTGQYDPSADFRDYARGLSNQRGESGYNDCLSLALLIYKAGQVWEHSASGIVNGLFNGLTERGGRFTSSDPNYRVGVFRRDPYYEKSFGYSGFNGTYQGGAFAPDPDSPNQVRHFVGWLAAGYLGITRADTRERLYNSEGGERDPTKSVDVALGLAAIELGENFRGDYKKLAQDVWHNICGERGDLTSLRSSDRRMIGV